MKKRFLLFALILAGAMGVQAQEQMALRLYATDGQQYDFLLADQSPRIQCAGGVMTISFKEEGATETDAVLTYVTKKKVPNCNAYLRAMAS